MTPSSVTPGLKPLKFPASARYVVSALCSTHQATLETICKFLHAGGSLSCVLETVGIHARVLKLVLVEATKAEQRLNPESEEYYQNPFLIVISRLRTAMSTCRVLAEKNVRDDNPALWLMRGPGRILDSLWAGVDEDNKSPLTPDWDGTDEVEQKEERYAIPPQDLLTILKTTRELDLSDAFQTERTGADSGSSEALGKPRPITGPVPGVAPGSDKRPKPSD